MYSRSAKGGEKGDPNRNPWLAKMCGTQLQTFLLVSNMDISPFVAFKCDILLIAASMNIFDHFQNGKFFSVGRFFTFIIRYLHFRKIFLFFKRMTAKLFMVVTVRLGNQYDYHLNKLYFTDSVHVCILYLSCTVKKFKTTVKLY